MTEHVKLNTPGAEDGAVHVYWNGKLVISAEDIAIRDYANSTFSGVHFQTFFGGMYAAFDFLRFLYTSSQPPRFR